MRGKHTKVKKRYDMTWWCDKLHMKRRNGIKNTYRFPTDKTNEKCHNQKLVALAPKCRKWFFKMTTKCHQGWWSWCSAAQIRGISDIMPRRKDHLWNPWTNIMTYQNYENKQVIIMQLLTFFAGKTTCLNRRIILQRPSVTSPMTV